MFERPNILFGAFYLEVTDDEFERILLHVGSLAPVQGLEDLKNILYRHIALEVGFAEHPSLLLEKM